MTTKSILRLAKPHQRIKYSTGDKVYYIFCYAIICVLTACVLYPLIYIVSASISSGSAVVSGKMWLWPVDISFYAYSVVLNYDYIWIGYRNTIFYTLAGTLINVCITLMCAYPLARTKLRGRGVFTFIFTFTMIFSGGMIPGYLLIKKLALINTVWAVILPGAMSVYNMIVTRTFIQSTIPDELLDAARIDGCSDTKFFTRIVLPLSKTIIAVNIVLYASAHWNAWFNAFLYISDKNLYPMQIFLRQILVDANFSADMLDPESVDQLAAIKELLRYSVIVISTAPLVCMYPFFQKYFVRGVMIGSLKG